MPKIDIRDYQGHFPDPENYCPHCGADEYSIHEDGLLRCDYCEELITDDNEVEFQRLEPIPTKKKFRD